MNRDRFVLSMGHASMLLYGLLHVAGVKEMTQVPTCEVYPVPLPTGCQREGSTISPLNFEERCTVERHVKELEEPIFNFVVIPLSSPQLIELVRNWCIFLQQPQCHQS